MPLAHLTHSHVQKVISLAIALNDAHPPSEEGIDIFDPADLTKVDAYIGSNERKALLDYLSRLTDEQRQELLALMWLGRGDAGPSDFGALLQHAKSMSDSTDPIYIAEKAPSLPRYLSRGLAII